MGVPILYHPCQKDCPQYCPFGKNRFGSVWYTIYHHLPVVIRGKQPPLLINQPMGKGHL